MQPIKKDQETRILVDYELRKIQPSLINQLVGVKALLS